MREQEAAAGPAGHRQLNLGTMRGNRVVYRIFSKERLFELFTSRENVLVRPRMWEDPFENFILTSPVRTARGELGEFAFHEDVYGQCWSLLQASDAMWRIYSADKTGVRVRTTIHKLASSLSAPLGEWAHAQAFIGKVRYLPDAELRTFATTIFSQGIDPCRIAQSLLVKRHAFSHEREVRLLYLEKDSQRKHARGLYRYAVDPHALIEQIMVDPRLPLEETNALMKEIRAETSFRGSLRRSLLYAPPRDFVVNVP